MSDTENPVYKLATDSLQLNVPIWSFLTLKFRKVM